MASTPERATAPDEKPLQDDEERERATDLGDALGPLRVEGDGSMVPKNTR